jgi:hypothetical protein
MNGATFPVLLAIIVQCSLAATVFQANPRRKANQVFLLLSTGIVGWLLSLYYAFGARDLAVAEVAIRQSSASAAGSSLRLTSCVSRFAGKTNRGRSSSAGRGSRSRPAAGAAIFCQSEWFLTAAVWPTHLVGTFALPRPVYGQYWYLYAVYFSLATLVLIIKTSRDIRSAAGRERAELAFILIVGILTLVVSLPLGIILGYFIDPAKALWFAPFRVLLFGLVMAYGIATRKVMEVGFFLRRAMSYLVLTAYLLALYGIVWWLVSRVFTPVFPDGSNSLAHVMAVARSGLRHGARPRHHAVVCEPSVHRHARPRLPHDDEQGDRDSAVGHDAPRFAAALREDDRRCRWDRSRADSARVAHCLRASPSAANGN